MSLPFFFPFENSSHYTHLENKIQTSDSCKSSRTRYILKGQVATGLRCSVYAQPPLERLVCHSEISHMMQQISFMLQLRPDSAK